MCSLPTGRVACGYADALFTAAGVVHDRHLIKCLCAAPCASAAACLQVEGTHNGAAVTGLGFVERNNFARVNSMDHFLKTVGTQVRRELDRFYTKQLTYDAMANVFVSPSTLRYLDGVDMNIVSKNLINPVRGITDRGGKSWRSYALLMW